MTMCYIDFESSKRAKDWLILTFPIVLMSFFLLISYIGNLIFGGKVHKLNFIEIYVEIE